MDIIELLDLLDSWIEKYQIEDEDVIALQEIINGLGDEDLYGDEYDGEEEPSAEELPED